MINKHLNNSALLYNFYNSYYFILNEVTYQNCAEPYTEQLRPLNTFAN